MLTIKPYQSTMIAVYRGAGAAIMRTVRTYSPENRASLERWIEREIESKRIALSV